MPPQYAVAQQVLCGMSFCHGLLLASMCVLGILACTVAGCIDAQVASYSCEN